VTRRAAPSSPDSAQRGQLHPVLFGAAKDRHSGFNLGSTLTFLSAAAEQRGGALAVPVAWNCLAFGYDLAQRQYTSTAIEVDTLPVVTAGQTTSAMPTGALIFIGTGSNPVAAEVVHREGADLAIADDGTVPSWLSGAPSGAVDPAGDATERTPGELVVDELLVVDAFALGAGRAEKLRRLRGRWLDSCEHLPVAAVYRDADSADQPEVRQYARHLLTTSADVVVTVLEEAGLRPTGPEWTTSGLTKALFTSMENVADLLELAGLLRWRDQAVAPKVIQRLLDDDVLDDLRRTLTSLAGQSLPAEGRRRARAPAPAYLALGSHLRHVYRAAAPEKISGRSYPALLAGASSWLAEELEATDRVVSVRGRDVHVRLDDAWQGGGIWRSALLCDGDELDDVTLPQSLGWFEALAAATSLPPHEPESVGNEATIPPTEPNSLAPASDSISPGIASEPLADQTADPEPVAASADDTTRTWTFPLTRRRAEQGLLPLTKLVAGHMGDNGLGGVGARIRLSHPGTDLDPTHQTQNAALIDRTLQPIVWPDEMFLGVMLTASWLVDGNLVEVRSTPLDVPQLLDGIPLDYEFDAEVVLRAWEAPADVDADDSAGISPARVLGLLRRNGRRVGGPSSGTAADVRLVLELTVLADAASRDLGHEVTVDQTAAAVDALTARSSMHGSVAVQWARWTADRSTGHQDPVSTGTRSGLAVADTAVLLSLSAKPSGRASKAVASPTVITVAGAVRRAHTRYLGSASPSAESRARLVEWAVSQGIDPARLDPRLTYVRSSKRPTYRRR